MSLCLSAIFMIGYELFQPLKMAHRMDDLLFYGSIINIIAAVCFYLNLSSIANLIALALTAVSNSIATVFLTNYIYCIVLTSFLATSWFSYCIIGRKAYRKKVGSSPMFIVFAIGSVVSTYYLISHDLFTIVKPAHADLSLFILSAFSLFITGILICLTQHIVYRVSGALLLINASIVSLFTSANLFKGIGEGDLMIFLIGITSFYTISFNLFVHFRLKEGANTDLNQMRILRG